jgi:hypothetical protein
VFNSDPCVRQQNSDDVVTQVSGLAYLDCATYTQSGIFFTLVYNAGDIDGTGSTDACAQFAPVRVRGRCTCADLRIHCTRRTRSGKAICNTAPCMDDSAHSTARVLRDKRVLPGLLRGRQHLSALASFCCSGVPAFLYLIRIHSCWRC